MVVMVLGMRFGAKVVSDEVVMRLRNPLRAFWLIFFMLMFNEESQ